MDEKEEKQVTPFEYFQGVKEKVKEINLDYVNNLYNNCLILLGKYKIAGQNRAAKKMQFHLESLIKEIDLIKLGVNKFIYRQDIEEYIDNVADKAVKIIELENYEREIPDDIVDLIDIVKDKFDKMYVVFTDYTGEVTRRIEKERREKDPILFGTLQNKDKSTVIDRFYYLGDWIDEYCDLTLDKMIYEMKKAKKVDISHEIKVSQTLDDLRAELLLIDFTDNGEIKVINKPKIKLFKRLKNAFTNRFDRK